MRSCELGNGGPNNAGQRSYEKRRSIYILLLGITSLAQIGYKSHSYTF